jgi:hypothetical protein
MTIFKLAYNFASAGGGFGSWSEILYTDEISINNAVTTARSLINLRLQFLNAANLLKNIRVSDITNPRATAPVLVNAIGQSVGNPPAPIDSAIVLSMVAGGPGGRRKLWLRGWSVGDAVRNDAGTADVFDGAFQGKVINWLNGVQAQSILILKRFETGLPGYGWVPIYKIIPLPAKGTSRVITQGTIPVWPSNLLTIGQASKKDLPGLNGIWSIIKSGNLIVPDPDAGNGFFDLAYVLPEGNQVLPEKGRLRPLSYYNTAIIQATGSGPQYIGGRKSKSPFSNSRGARSAARGIRLSL